MLAADNSSGTLIRFNKYFNALHNIDVSGEYTEFNPVVLFERTSTVSVFFFFQYSVVEQNTDVCEIKNGNRREENIVNRRRD